VQGCRHRMRAAAHGRNSGTGCCSSPRASGPQRKVHRRSMNKDRGSGRSETRRQRGIAAVHRIHLRRRPGEILAKHRLSSRMAGSMSSLGPRRSCCGGLQGLWRDGAAWPGWRRGAALGRCARDLAYGKGEGAAHERPGWHLKEVAGDLGVRAWGRSWRESRPVIRDAVARGRWGN